MEALSTLGPRVLLRTPQTHTSQTPQVCSLILFGSLFKRLQPELLPVDLIENNNSYYPVF